jgi:predicted AlkP superfamily pyrophosphatase or phosphodiesterase
VFWDALRAGRPGFTCAKLFWWFNMYSTADYSITPRPLYPADGRKIFDIYTWPYSIRTELQQDLGPFPFPTFWGPPAGVDSPQGKADAASRWIADAARWTEQRYQPTLSLIYLPHLDYPLQRLGPHHPSLPHHLNRIDSIAGDLIQFFEDRGVRVAVLSEYGISPVQRPIHLNRHFRDADWLTVKEELGRELLDPGASRAFAVADHQVAHLYLNDPHLREPVRHFVASIPGVDRVLDQTELASLGLDHRRAGDLVAVAREDSWFTYYYWPEDQPQRAPDFARTVDIHRKPGYDPAELFLDPTLPAVKLRILWRLLQKRLGFRMLMDVIPINASLVRGSHGRIPTDPQHHPILITHPSALGEVESLNSTEVAWVLRRLLS